MGRAKKVVLAYSGGVDTSVCIPYLKQEWGVEEVITLAADLGQGDELEPIRQKALDSGASVSLVAKATESFIIDYAFPALKANALYENRYPLSTALARPLIAKLLVEAAAEYGADAVTETLGKRGECSGQFVGLGDDVAVTDDKGVRPLFAPGFGIGGELVLPAEFLTEPSGDVVHVEWRVVIVPTEDAQLGEAHVRVINEVSEGHLAVFPLAPSGDEEEVA